MSHVVLKLDMETLKQLGGGAAFLQIQKLLEQAVFDIKSRPGDKRARKVVLALELTPKTHNETSEDGLSKQLHLDGVSTKLHMDVKLPPRRTIEFDMGVSDNNELLFNPYCPANWRQSTLPTLDAESNPPSHADSDADDPSVLQMDGKARAVRG